MKLHLIYLMITTIMLAVTGIGCEHTKRTSIQMDIAEHLLETRPDSALIILQNINIDSISNQKDKARYALLKSMALDKNYIYTTSFKILRPAIDYYLSHGDANQKIRTYYYQGRIYQNKGDDDNAMSSFVNGLDLIGKSTDSLTTARMLVAQALIYKEIFNIKAFTNNNLRAADIYKLVNRAELNYECLLNALNGYLLLNNKQLADSLYAVCSAKANLFPDADFEAIKLSYMSKYGSVEQIQMMLHDINGHLHTINDYLNIAYCYNKIDSPDIALGYLNIIPKSDYDLNKLKFDSISTIIYEKLGDYENALSSYKAISKALETIHNHMFENKIQFSEEKHSLELYAKKNTIKLEKQIWISIGVSTSLVLFLIILFLLNKSAKSSKELAIQRYRATELENEKLKIERNKIELEAENLKHRIDDLETEREELSALVTKGDLSPDVKNTIKVRLEMLNSILASYITSNDKYEKSYELWVKELTNNAEQFMNSNRIAFQCSHPEFIKYFSDHSLTQEEINYVCLYAIGLRGKDVGTYIKKPSYVNMSSNIRKKLGINKFDTNIGIYVRRLLKEL